MPPKIRRHRSSGRTADRRPGSGATLGAAKRAPRGGSAPAAKSAPKAGGGPKPSAPSAAKGTASVRPSRREVGDGAPAGPMRIAKALARAGLCSRREAERWIEEGRVTVNGRVHRSPALDVGPADRIRVDGQPLPVSEPPRLWRYHKPRGLVTTHRDPEGRPTVFEALPADLPRVMSIGRLDYNSEGLLLLTNDGDLARHIELPATGWLRRYRARAFGDVTQADLDRLKDGIEIEGVRYGPIEATLDKQQGDNAWVTLGLREGKNREVRKILSHLGLSVNRLIRISFGPFQLLDLPPGGVEAVKRRILIDQLGDRLAGDLGIVEEETEPARRSRLRRAPARARGGEDSGTA